MSGKRNHHGGGVGHQRLLDSMIAQRNEQAHVSQDSEQEERNGHMLRRTIEAPRARVWIVGLVNKPVWLGARWLAKWTRERRRAQSRQLL